MYIYDKGFPGGSVVKNSHVNAGHMLRSLGLEDPLEKEVATYSSFLAWEISGREEPSRLQSVGPQKSQTQLNNLTKHQEHTVWYVPGKWGK